MPLQLAALLIVVGVAASVAVMLVARRRAPRGGYFADTGRAVGVLEVIGTGFAVFLAFVIFLSFESFDRARDRSSAEAVATAELFQTASYFAATERDELQGLVICYARAVVADEWPAMRELQRSALVDDWRNRLTLASTQVTVEDARTAAAFEHWLDTAAARGEARRGRIAESSPFVPPLAWIMLVTTGVLLLAFVAALADSAESRVAQGLKMGVIAALVVSGLVLIAFLERPYVDTPGAVQPVQMRTEIAGMESQYAATGGPPVPCNAEGRTA